jgi:hypothetical protein
LIFWQKFNLFCGFDHKRLFLSYKVKWGDLDLEAVLQSEENEPKSVKIDRQGESIETDQSLMKEDALIVEID